MSDRGEDRRTSTGLRFPPDLHATLTEAARERGLTLNFLVVQLCREGMERLIPVDEVRWTRVPAAAPAPGQSASEAADIIRDTGA